MATDVVGVTSNFAKIIAGLAASLLVYVLSIGPVYSASLQQIVIGLHADNHEDAALGRLRQKTRFYAPLDWLRCHSDSLDEALQSYCDLWLPGPR